MGRPLLELAAVLALGCLIGADVSPRAALVLLAFAGGLLGLGLLAPRPGSASVALGAAALAIGAASAGAERAAYLRAPLEQFVDQRGDVDDPVRLAGVVAADPRDVADRWVLLLDTDAGPAAGRARIHVAGQAPRLELIEGDRVAVWASLRRPRAFLDPGAYDAEAAAYREGIHALGSVKSPWLVERRGRAGGGLAGAAAVARHWARSRLQALLLPGPEQGLVRAMVLGDRTGVDTGTAEAFRIAGTYHVLALSGAQVALVAGLLIGVARLLGLSPGPTGLLVSAALAFYARFVGADPPVVRAALTAIVMLLGRSLDLDSDLGNLLGLAAGLLLLHRPSAITDASFQLSFAATLGIVLLTPALLVRLPSLPLRLELTLAASCAAQLSLAPLLAYHFHRLAPAALLLNLVAVPLAGAVLVAGFVVLLAAAAAPPLAPYAADAAWLAAHALLASGEIVRGRAWLDLRVPTPGFWAVALLFAGLLALVAGRRSRCGVAFVAAGLWGLVLGPGPPPGDGRLHLTVLDVGQGDALVLRSPSGRVRMVDAGGAYDGGFDFGEAVVGPYLWSEGLRRVESLLLTHAHVDHVGGAPFLATAFGVGEVWEGPAPTHDRIYDALSASLDAAGARRRAVARGMRFDWDGVAVEVLGPRPRGQRSWSARNDDSVVLSLRLGGVGFLLAGDAEAGEEVELPPAPSAVLKVPHHGSRTSSTPALLAATAPLLAVISVGHANHFGHPSPQVLARYRERGIRVLRTDQDGAVTVATDGAGVWLRSFRDGAWQRIR